MPKQGGKFVLSAAEESQLQQLIRAQSTPQGLYIFLQQPGVGNISFDGGRSENAVRFVISSSFSSISYATVKIANYTVVNLRNTDGQGVQIGWLATFDNVAIFGANAPQYFFLRGGGVDNENPAILTARSCVSDHPFPFQTSRSRPGKIIRSSGIRFSGDSAFQLWSRNTRSNTWVRRMNVTSTAPSRSTHSFTMRSTSTSPGAIQGSLSARL